MGQDLTDGKMIDFLISKTLKVDKSFVDFEEKTPAAVTEALKLTLESKEAFHNNMGFKVSLVDLKYQIEALQTAHDVSHSAFGKGLAKIAGGVGALALMAVSYPHLRESFRERNRIKSEKDSSFQTSLEIHQGRITKLKSNFSLAETILSQIGQIRHSSSARIDSDFNSLADKTTNLQELNLDLLRAYEKALAPILKIGNKEKAEKALTELENKLTTSNLTSDFRHGTVLGVGVRQSTIGIIEALNDVTDRCVNDFELLISQIAQAA